MKHSGDAKQPFDQDGMVRLRDEIQGGVISRRQLRELHARDHDIRRLVRSREVAVIHPGVYVNHTGNPTWGQRAWAAVLVCWPAALTGRSALPSPPERGPIEVMVPMSRTVRAPGGVVIRRRARFDGYVDWAAYPPRQLLAEAAIDAAVDAGDAGEAFSMLADLVQTKVVRTSALLEALRRRPRMRDRRLLRELLEDLKDGACSVLEREYLRRVERAHGLPAGERQVADSIAGVFVERDVTYVAYGVVVELDGRAFHGSAAARDADHARDLDAAVTRNLRTVRLTYGQVLGDPCRTATRIGELLGHGGWPGKVTPCIDCLADRD
ncbi:type IV toxin-antitoxin system AbiEi family antitoxin domain-containing protein [Nocardioides albus]|uniref:Type IV toxin-antitoxin system AbiEi family antitoxin domain-containing protein n=1 Tax=Nocardioides albus TaxID=1841 RepID=A0A7W5A6X8_9ACTN|nr:type IV toxin-antitoxin system AbiEi family antitoxin domain-containing protein [Nocardioides albus]MBB3090727.1 hypothetical protein [Nocardioides albus]GGU26063.1 hypothetical protein GCM10007979_26110 [Nocardioides albus]